MRNQTIVTCCNACRRVIPLGRIHLVAYDSPVQTANELHFCDGLCKFEWFKHHGKKEFVPCELKQ